MIMTRIADFNLLQTADQPTLSMRTITTMQTLPELIGATYEKIGAYLGELGIQPQDAPYVAYFNLDPEHLDVEIGFPVPNACPDRDEIKAGVIPGGIFAATYNLGPYDQLEPVYNEMARWMEINELFPTGTAYEYYLNGPELGPDQLLTRIVLPLK